MNKFICCFRLDGRLKRRRYNNVDLEATLPEGFSACDIGTFIIWCEPFGAIFTRIEVPREIFVSIILYAKYILDILVLKTCLVPTWLQLHTCFLYYLEESCFKSL